VQAGGGSVIQIGSPASPGAQGDSIELSQRSIHALLSGLGARLNSASDDGKAKRDLTAVESSLSREIDGYRDLLKAGFPSRASQFLRTLLAKLPEGATPYIRFRIKANVAYCLLQLDDKDGGLAWLDDAVDSAPTESKAIAVKVFAQVLREDFEGAVELAKEALAADQTNEDVAAHLVEASINLDTSFDPEPLVPLALRDRERILIARCVLHRQRESRPAWWKVAKLGVRRFPESDMLRLFAAEAVVDEIARATRNEVHRPLTESELKQLRRAAADLEAIWEGLKRSEIPNRDDGMSALTSAMIAYRLLEEKSKATAMAGEVIDRSEFEPALIVAVQVALAFEDDALVDRGMAKLPDEGEAGFVKGVAAMNKGEPERAAEILKRAAVPAHERVFVDAMIALAPINETPAPEDEGILERVRAASSDEPRALVIVARMAKQRNLVDLANAANAEVLKAIGPGMSYPARLMIASYAYGCSDFGTVINVLDGHVDTSVLTKELQWLSDAHASENPTRKRNLRFYERLAKPVRETTTIASGHASILLDFGKEKEAENILRRVVAEAPNDTFAKLKLAEALKRQGRDQEAAEVIVSADESKLVGPLGLRLTWAHALRESGDGLRALAFGYDLVRSHPNQPRIALGYVGLILGRDEVKIPLASAVAADTWVALESEAGERDAFIIDNGASFLGLDVVPPGHERAKRVMGLRAGDRFGADGLGDRSQTWTVKEVKSKYLHVLHVIMEEFERRFPATNGLWRFTMREGEVQPVLDLIKEQAEGRRENARRLYVEGHMPLAIAARALGSDVVSFAQYLRLLDIDIVTSGATPIDRDRGIETAREYRGVGAVMDTYTAITAAEIDALAPLKEWYGTLAVPRSCIDEIDGLLNHAKASLGRNAMSVAFHKGQFIRQNIDDAFLNRQIEALQTVRDRLLAHCEVVAVALPDDVQDEVAAFTRETGREATDAMFLAQSLGSVLLSEDLHYRQISQGLTKVDGTWLQATFTTIHDTGALKDAALARFNAKLAFRRHGNLWLDVPLMMLHFEQCDAEEFNAVCHFLGSVGADMHAHTRLVAGFLSALWRRKDPGYKREAYTSIVLTALLRHQGGDWPLWLALVGIVVGGNAHLARHLARWRRGHFLPSAYLHVAMRYWAATLAQLQNTPSLGTTVHDNEALLSVRVELPVRPGPRPNFERSRAPFSNEADWNGKLGKRALRRRRR